MSLFTFALTHTQPETHTSTAALFPHLAFFFFFACHLDHRFLQTPSSLFQPPLCPLLSFVLMTFDVLQVFLSLSNTIIIIFRSWSLLSFHVNTPWFFFYPVTSKASFYFFFLDVSSLFASPASSDQKLLTCMLTCLLHSFPRQTSRSFTIQTSTSPHSFSPFSPSFSTSLRPDRFRFLFPLNNKRERSYMWSNTWEIKEKRKRKKLFFCHFLYT